MSRNNKRRRTSKNYINPNKSSINKTIKWSTSRFNEDKKSDVVNDILNKVNSGKDYKGEYRTGSYSHRGNLGGWRYKLIIKNKKAKLIYKSGNRRKVYFFKQPK